MIEGPLGYTGPDPDRPPQPPPLPPSMTPRERERDSSAAAWSAAAVVLAVGALVFGVLAHLRITDLEERVATLEAQSAARSTPLAPGFEETIGSTNPVATTISEPTDPEASRAQITAAFKAVYDGVNGVDVRLGSIDDPTGVEAAIRQVQATDPAAVSGTTVNVNDIQFVSPTRAKVIYGITVAGQPAALGRAGEARVVSGAWKVTRRTVCDDLQAVGGIC